MRHCPRRGHQVGYADVGELEHGFQYLRGQLPRPGGVPMEGLAMTGGSMLVALTQGEGSPVAPQGRPNWVEESEVGSEWAV